LDWDRLSEVEREAFVDGLLHDDLLGKGSAEIIRHPWQAQRGPKSLRGFEFDKSRK
jgi:hypothetical protein